MASEDHNPADGDRLKAVSLPEWPRGLSEDEAAAYVGVSPGKFRTEVETGLWPKGARRGGRVIWDKVLLDKAYDRFSGVGASRDTDDIDEAIENWRPKSQAAAGRKAVRQPPK